MGGGFSLESLIGNSLCIYRWRRRRFAGAEGGSRLLQFGLNLHCEQMRVVMLAGLVTIPHFTSNASRRVVGQWGGAGGAGCEDHLALAGD